MKRSKFNLSNYQLLSCNQGQLVPIGITEVLPGDSIQHATQLLVRVQPLNTPVMHPVHVKVDHFFVPYRLLWANGIDDSFEAFITGGHDGLDASTFPTITINNAAIGSLADYLGVPTGVAQNVPVSALPFRAYALIFNEFYRDQDLVTPLVIDLTGGSDTTTNVTLQSPAWEKDYFTSARPWAQKGAEVTLPLGTTAPLVTTGVPPQMSVTGWTNAELNWNTSINALDLENIPDGTASDAVTFGANDIIGAEVDLTEATPASINDIRLAMAVQRFQEARARYGSRYTEYLRYLGVRSSDARLQRPEPLGRGRATIQFSEVLQQAPSTSGTPGTGVGILKGHGIGSVRSNRYRRFFEEHGIIMSLLRVQPKTVYFKGLNRLWNRRSKTDFWQKELQHVGQQEILKKEIYMQGTSADDEMWGFQDRYDEYRRSESSVHGAFRTTLNTWHMARDFSSLPTPNGSFVTADPTNRVYQDTSGVQLQILAYHSMQARRLLAKVGTSYVY